MTWWSVATVTAASATLATTASSTEATATAATSVTALASATVLLLVVLKPVSEEGEWGLDGLGAGPEIWGKVLVGVGNSLVASLDEVLGGTGHTGGGSVHIIDTGELQNLLWNWGSDNTSTSWGWGQLEADRTTLTSGLDWHSVDLTDLVTPIASADWDEGELGAKKGTLDGDLHFLGELDAETDVALVVTNNDDSLEAGALTGLGLLLNRHNLHNLIGKLAIGILDKLVNDWGLLDWDGVGVNLLKSLDLAVLDETTKLGAWDPVVLAAEAAATTATTTTTATATATTTAVTESTALSVLLSWLLCLSFH